MTYATMHKEDVKAELRKRFGSVHEFERRQGLRRDSVSDLLRGKTSAAVVTAIDAALLTPLDPPEHSGKPDTAGTVPSAQSLNTAVR